MLPAGSLSTAASSAADAARAAVVSGPAAGVDGAGGDPEAEAAVPPEPSVASGTGPAAGPSRAAPRARRKVARIASTLALDLEAVADVDGLAQEVALLRASIRRLARPDSEAGEHVKVLAELRHQVEALCTALKTQLVLEGNGGDARAAELARVLDELGDELGVPR
ncbi:MAG: hypothetical protein AB7P40_26930 [Chloroflexota bacterium]